MENLITLPTNYASFGRRLVAFIIDGILVGVAQSFVVLPILGFAGVSVAAGVSPDDLENMTDSEKLAMLGAMSGAFGVAQLIN